MAKSYGSYGYGSATLISRGIFFDPYLARIGHADEAPSHHAQPAVKLILERFAPDRFSS